MAYSFARSGRGENRDLSPNRRIEDSLGETRNESGPENLDFGFAWLNDYDKAGNYRINRDDLRETQQENPYGWNALGPRISGGGDLRQTVEAGQRQASGSDVRQTSGVDRRLTAGSDLRQTYGNDLRQTNRYGRGNTDELRQTSRYDGGHTDDLRQTSRYERGRTDDLRQTSRYDGGRTDDLRQTSRYERGHTDDFRRTSSSDHGHTTRDALQQTQTIGLRNTEGYDHRETIQLDNFAETQKENPYGWKALGPTRRAPSIKAEVVDLAKTNNFEKTVKENPYGWNALGPTRRPPSQNSDDASTIRIPRKRSHQTSFARRIPRDSRADRPNVVPSEGRVIKHAKRLSSLPEEGVINGDIRRGGALRTSAEGDTALRDTTDGGGIRGTTYDYAMNIISEPTFDPSTRERADARIPERTQRERTQRNWASVNAPEDGSKHWIDIATDYSLMSKWYEMFAKIKRRWAANYKDPSLLSGLSEDTASRPVVSRKRLKSRKNVNGRLKLALISAVVFIVLLVAVVVPVSIFTANASGKEAEDKLWLYDLQATVNRTFTVEMSDNSSDAFRSISQPFCDLIDVNGNNSSSNYIGCLVTSLSDGSIIVNFDIVIRATAGNAPGIIDLLAVISLQNESQLGPFQFSVPVVVVSRRLIGEVDNPIPDDEQFNETCSSIHECKSYFSKCINSTCVCPDNRLYENTSDTCLPIYCGNITEIADGNFNISGNNFGDVLSIECNIGYELSENNSIVCTSEESWESLPTCNIIQCEDFVVPEHARIDSENTHNKTFLDEITIFCEEGFELDGKTKTVCQFDKTWSNNSRCEPVNCTEPDLPNNILFAAENNSFVFESVIELDCSAGYKLNGERNISCLANKTWTEFPWCTPVPCPTLQFPVNAAEQENATDKVFGEEIVIQCSVGYNISGNNTVKCLEDGTWSERPNCTIIDCGDLEEPVNGEIEYAEGTHFNMTQKVSCNEGYKLSVGSGDIVTCTRYGNWSGMPECELKMCPYPNDIQHGKFVSNISMEIYTELMVECMTGFDLIGNSNVTCMKNETWSEFPRCKPVDCGVPPPVQNGKSVMINETTFNVSFSVECLDGYELNGSISVVCESAGNWSALPSCSARDCGMPSWNATILSSTETQLGDVIELGCEEGFDLTGNSTIACQDNGTWSEFPICKIKDCGAIEIENGWVSYENGTVFESIASIECNVTYGRIGNENIKCLADGNWEPLPFCDVTNCGDFIPPENSFIEKENQTVYCYEGYELIGESKLICLNNALIFNGTCKPLSCLLPNVSDNLLTNYDNETVYTSGKQINVSCEDGFSLGVGEEILTCQANGKWSTSPLCIPTHCPIPELLPNVEIVNSSKELFDFNETLYIRCTSGFILDGANILSCFHDGTWLGSAKCLPINCSLPDVPDNFDISNGLEVKYSVNSSVILYCNSGFTTHGNETIVCQADGNWSAIPECIPVSCPIFNLPNNILFAAENNSFVFESVIELDCSAGYILNGERNISCLANKTWTEFPLCTPVPCPTLQFPDNAVEQENTTDKVFGEEIVIQCSVGYNISGNNTVKCLEDGTWSERPNCTIIDCGDLEEPVNGEIEYAEGTHFNMTQKVSCNEGYKLSVGSGDIVTCTRYGNWSGMPECELKMCPYPNDIQHGKFVSNISMEIYTELMVECTTGFDLIGNSNVTCMKNETWSEFPRCEPVDCGVSPPVQNGKSVMINETTFNVSFSVECLDGYELNGSMSVVCESTGHWSALPSCSARDCGMPTWNATGTQFGDVIELGCEEGFDLTGNSTIACQDNGTWSEFPICKIKDCGEIEIENGWVSYENGTVFESIASIECNDTYDRIGNANVKCLADGNWEPLPFCDVTNCGDFIPPENSFIEKENQTVYCDEGYELIGESKLICLNNTLVFNGTCKPVTCLLPNVSDHLLTSYDNEILYSFGKQINVSCEDGFALGTEEEFLTCQANGKWSTSPSCIPTHCPIPELLPNVEIINSSKELFDFNETLYTRCTSGFILDGANMLSCFYDGTWLGSTKCLPINCSLPDISDNFNTSNVVDVKYSVNSSVILNCNSGFTIHGNETIVCQPDGNWSAIPECIPVSCPIFNQPDNSLTPDFNESAKFQYSDIVTIECDTGYNISGDENVTCQEDGTWTTIPECSKVRCDVYQLENGQTGNQTFYSDELEISCNLGYDLSSNDAVICTENGQWSSNPTCELVDCEEFTLPEHSFVANNETSTLINTTLEVSCKTDYVLANEDEAFVTCGADGNWTGNPECERIPAINFAETAATAEIGSTLQLQCVLVGKLPTLDVIIARNSTVQGEQLVCNVSQTGVVNCSVPGISANGLTNGKNFTVTITVDPVDCEDEGIYYCASVSNTSLNAAFNLSVTKPAFGVPLLSLPVRMVANLSEQSHNISCTADVGYPAGDLRIEYRTDNFTSFGTLDIGTEKRTENSSGCSVNKTVTIEDYTFTESWNNTDIRCAVYKLGEDDIPNEVSDIAKIELISNDCPSTGIIYQYHLLNCHYYIFCNYGFIEVVDSCGAKCPDIQNSTSHPICDGNCASLGC